ncbi:hypothetical protein EJ110_NYTH55108 [Nymphaea thermarum]|nr:hypothetical protein EJ110_NYTH55108 [Nymphaea thermarum]
MKTVLPFSSSSEHRQRNFLTPLIPSKINVAGFVSIDCGLTESPSYVDENDKLTYVSDDGFVDSGVSVQVDPELKEGTKQYQTVRAFPNYTRNCYYFQATIGVRYFIRAAFMYGNYDGLNSPPNFDLYLGVDLWDNIKLDNVTHRYWSEIIVQADLLAHDGSLLKKSCFILIIQKIKIKLKLDLKEDYLILILGNILGKD